MIGSDWIPYNLRAGMEVVIYVMNHYSWFINLQNIMFSERHFGLCMLLANMAYPSSALLQFIEINSKIIPFHNHASRKII